MDVPRHFAEPGFVSHAKRVSDEEYARTLDTVVVSCVDCVLVHRGRMLIGFRASEPYVGWWVIGGRMHPGEDFCETAQRITKRETGLYISDSSRFEYLNTISYVWARRAQAPQDHGCHMIGNNLIIILSDEEMSATKKTSDFTELKWIKPSKVLRVGSPVFHQAIQYFARQAALREGDAS